jgi:hypothetical protein
MDPFKKHTHGPIHGGFGIPQDLAGNPIFLSEAQLVLADPCAELQQWHLDSATGRGRPGRGTM